MEKNSFDITIIGGGQGGYVAAIRAAQLGASVLLIEKDKLGGTCVNRGCIPTKAMLADLKLYHQVKLSSVIETSELRVNMEKLLKRKEGVVKTLRSGIGLLIKNNRITFSSGKAEFLGSRTIEVETEKGKEQFESSRTIIATGSVSGQFSSGAVDGKNIVTSTEMLNLSTPPKNLVVIGGGYIGMEFACLFNELGSNVTVIEMLPSILASEDEEIVETLVTILKKRGIQIHTETNVKEAKAIGGCVQVTALNKEGEETVFKAEKVLVAVGRSPYTDGLHLEKANVVLSGEFIKVDEWMETSTPGIYAIGDVTGRQMLAHKASAEGIAAAENAAGGRARVDYSTIPNCIFTFPEIASIGLTKKQAEEKGQQVMTGRFPFVNSGRALATGESEGLVKVIADKGKGQIVGIHILGDHATDLIGGSTIALAVGATAEELGKSVQAHPTLMEAVAEASLDAVRNTIHLPKKKR